MGHDQQKHNKNVSYVILIFKVIHDFKNYLSFEAAVKTRKSKDVITNFD